MSPTTRTSRPPSSSKPGSSMPSSTFGVAAPRTTTRTNTNDTDLSGSTAVASEHHVGTSHGTHQSSAPRASRVPTNISRPSTLRRSGGPSDFGTCTGRTPSSQQVPKRPIRDHLGLAKLEDEFKSKWGSRFRFKAAPPTIPSQMTSHQQPLSAPSASHAPFISTSGPHRPEVPRRFRPP